MGYLFVFVETLHIWFSRLSRRMEERESKKSVYASSTNFNGMSSYKFVFNNNCFVNVCVVSNISLNNAKKAKNDEFYTRIEDIEKELVNYGDFFKDKVVYCNCDHPTESNFPRYFLLNFEKLGLKKLVSTCFISDGNGWVGIKEKDVEYTIEQLEGNGDFRSEECIEFLKQADVVVTNPPFSLFRDYVKQLMDYGKKFLIIGNGNAVTYKEIFPYIKNNQLWIGNKCFSGGMDFIAGKNYDASKCKHPKYDDFGNIIINVMMCVWFTNIPHTKRNTKIDLYRKYNETDFPKYDNYDAIECGKVTDIPEDYNGVMGVPITFLDKYCPTQFEIVGITSPFLNGKKLYKRLFIKRVKNNETKEI